MSRNSNSSPADLTALRLIPIMKPGAPAVRFEIAKSDEDEQNVRADAVARGLVAGRPMMPQPNPRFWSLVIGR